MKSTKMTKSHKQLISMVAIVVVSLVFVIDSGYFTHPPLRSDDWNMLVEPVAFGSVDLFDIADRRPLLLLLFAILSPVFQLKISLYYVVNWILIIISGYIVFRLVQHAFPKFQWLALPTSLIFMIYPVNYARTWLVISINTFALLLGVLAILFMIRFTQVGKTWHLVLANTLVLLSLGIYEAGLGIILLSGLFMIFDRKYMRKRRMWVVTILGAATFFILWRLFLQPRLFAVSDFYLSSMSLSVSTLVKRFSQGLFIFLFNWTGPLMMAFRDYKYHVFVGMILILLAILGLLIWRQIKEKCKLSDDEFTVSYGRFRELLKISGIGFLFWFAGYIPVITVWQPIFYGDGSRVNFAAIPGASLAIVAFLGALFSLLHGKKNQIKKGVLIAIVPLVIAGMAYQVHAQNFRQEVWEVNRIFWRLMFDQVPGIKSKTKVVIVIPGYEELEPFEMLPFRGDWEAESALRVLYNDKSLFAEYFYIDRLEEADNWQPIGGDLGRFLFVYYDPSNTTFRLIENPFEALKLPSPVENYDSGARIVAYQDEMGRFRYLVE